LNPNRLSGLAGIATALAMTIALSIYFRSRYRSLRDLVRRYRVL
jgi:hypothetical protein